MRRLAARYALVALSLAGSAILLFSCEKNSTGDAAAEETLMTEYSENLSIVMSRNGRRSYHFVTPLVEGYSLAREPYREFRKGVKITTYQDDSLSTVDAVLTANYAIYYENRDLWEARGDVVVVKSDGKTLYTQQLFWNAKTKKIYSNVDSKIVQTGGRDVFIGEGFESDEEFKDWRFRRMKGRMEVEVAPTAEADSTAVPGRPAATSESGATARPASRLRSAAPAGHPRPSPDHQTASERGQAAYSAKTKRVRLLEAPDAQALPEVQAASSATSAAGQQPVPSVASAAREQQPLPAAASAAREQQPVPSATPAAGQQSVPSTTSAAGQQPLPSAAAARTDRPHALTGRPKASVQPDSLTSDPR